MTGELVPLEDLFGSGDVLPDEPADEPAADEGDEPDDDYTTA